MPTHKIFIAYAREITLPAEPDKRPRFIDLPPETVIVSAVEAPAPADDHTMSSEIYNASFAPESPTTAILIQETAVETVAETPPPAATEADEHADVEIIEATEFVPDDLPLEEHVSSTPPIDIVTTDIVPTIDVSAPETLPMIPTNIPMNIETESSPMHEKIRLSRLLITNDDGIDAAGLAVLVEVAADLADEVWVIAPEHDQSGTAISLGLHQARRVYPRGDNRFAVNGTPADCVALSSYLMRDARPQLILSGINVGENIGDDANVSGTLGAALTGLMLRIPAIAISQCFTGDRKDIQWDAARVHLPRLLQALLQQGWRKETCLSINIPALPPDEIVEAVWTRQAPRTINGFTVAMRTDLRGGDYYWLNLTHPQNYNAGADTDYAAIHRGQISITCVGLDRSRDADNESISLLDDEEG